MRPLAWIGGKESKSDKTVAAGEPVEHNPLKDNASITTAGHTTSKGESATGDDGHTVSHVGALASPHIG